jgi:hypothetical protein
MPRVPLAAGGKSISRGAAFRCGAYMAAASPAILPQRGWTCPVQPWWPDSGTRGSREYCVAAPCEPRRAARIPLPVLAVTLLSRRRPRRAPGQVALCRRRRRRLMGA